MNKSFRFVSVLALMSTAFMATGCATIFKGSYEKVTVASDQGGAKIYIDGQYYGVTPTEVKLESSRTHTIEFKKEGYQTRAVVITRSIGAGWLILDILGGLVPVIVDAATQNWYNLDTNHVTGNLEAVSIHQASSRK